MGNKFVKIDDNGVVQEPYDEDNKNVPDDAVQITNAEFDLLKFKPFNYFRIVSGNLVENEPEVLLINKEQQKARLRQEKLDSMLTVEFAEIDAATTKTAAKAVTIK